MRHLFGLVLAGGMVLSLASSAKAQFSMSIGNPYGGGIAINNGYGYGYPGLGYRYGGFAPGIGATSYSSGYSGYVAPGVSNFVSGNFGAYPYGAYGYGNIAPVYGYSSAYPYAGYGYRRFGYGMRGFGVWNRGYGRYRGW